jgi:hypothetical protein
MSRNKKPANKYLAMVPDCIFCGKRADSEEDAFPKWLIKRYPQPPAIMERLITVGGESEVRFGTLKIGVKCVCQPCNNNWMSVIQNNHAKPVITRLLEEKSLTLDLEDCRSLTQWSVMTSMVLDVINSPAHWRFTELERCLFWKVREIPKHFYVWVSRWKNSTGPSVVGHLLSRDGTPHNAVVNTIGFGTLILQVLKMNVDISPQSRPGRWDRSLLQVYPPQGNPISYPPPTEIDGYSGLEELDLRFSPPGADSGKPSVEVLKKAINRLHRSSRRSGQSPPA